MCTALVKDVRAVDKDLKGLKEAVDMVNLVSRSQILYVVY